MKNNKPLVIIGKGSHSKVVKEAALASGSPAVKRLDYKKVRNFLSKKNIRFYNFIIGVGDNEVRRKIFKELKTKSCKYISVIHPTAVISKSAIIKNGSFIGSRVVITNDVTISENSIINTSAIIDHNSIIGAHSHIAPGVKIAGNVTIGKLCFIGVGSTIKDGISISDKVLLGAGAVATKDLETNSTFVGIPAKKLINSNNLKILFLGRDKCKFSKKIFLYLRKNKIDVSFLKTNLKNNKLILKKLNNFDKSYFDYLISFRNLLVLKEKILNKIRYACVNFHPGPPNYRGIGCANFAINNQEKKYGCTTHLMNKKIDNGKVLDVRYFTLKKNIEINSLVKKTHALAYEMFLDFFKEIFKNNVSINTLAKRCKNVKWSKKIYNRKQLNNLYNINPKINKEKLNILLKATNYGSFRPYILSKGKKFFFYKKNVKKNNYITLFNKRFYSIK